MAPKRGLRDSVSLARGLRDSVEVWPAFPDSVEALQRLRPRFKLVTMVAADAVLSHLPTLR